MPDLICRADDRAAWLAARLSGVTATDIVTILGLSARDSVYSLYWRKMGQVPEPADTDRWRLGRDLEKPVLDRWAEASGNRFYLRAGLYRSSARPWQMATPDRLTGAGEPIEVKTWADADKASWGPPGGSGMPASVRAQVLWQMDVMDAAEGHIGVLFLPSGEFRHPQLSRRAHGIDQDIELMRAAGEEFWRRLRMELPPPDPDNSAATLAAARARFAKAKGKRGRIDLMLWNPYVGTLHELDRWQENKRALEIQIREQLGEADEIEVDGQLVGKRITCTQHVKEHDRHMDYIKRTKAGTDE